MVQHGSVFTASPSLANPYTFQLANVLKEVYHLDTQAVKGYITGMEKKHTTMRFTPQDLEAIKLIRERYGCISDTAAVRLALQLVIRGELPPSPKPQTRTRFHPHG
jgi:hypothetical protein